MLVIFCKNCSTSFQSYKSLNAQFCSRICFETFKKSNRDFVTCKNCNTQFRKVKSKETKYCSRACYETKRPAKSVKDKWSSKVKFGSQDECWLWLASKNKKGYGTLGEGLAHRISYELHYGSFDYSLSVCHSCDNPSCVNPKHLWLGTSNENMQDMVKKKRADRTKKHVQIYKTVKKFSIEDIRSIRNMFSKGVKQSDILEDYPMSVCNLRKILNYKTWKLV